MNVIIVSPSYIPTDTRVIEEANILKNNGYNVFLLGINEKEERGSMNGMDYFLLEKSNNPFVLWNRLLSWSGWGNYDKAIIGDLYFALLIPFLKKKKYTVIADAHELASGVYDVYNSPLKRFYWKLIEHLCVPYADGFITVSDSIADYYERIFKNDVPVFYNLSPMYKEEEIDKENGKFRYIYAGGIMKGRDIDKIVQSAYIIKNKGYNNIECVIAGGGSYLSQLKKIDKEGIVYFTGFLNSIELYKEILRSNVGIVSLKGNVPNHKYSMPNKLFLYLSAKIPVLVPDYEEMSNYVRKNGCGKILYDFSAEEIAKNIIYLYENIKEYERIKNIVRKNRDKFIWKYQEKRFIEYIESVWEK